MFYRVENYFFNLLFNFGSFFIFLFIFQSITCSFFLWFLFFIFIFSIFLQLDSIIVSGMFFLFLFWRQLISLLKPHLSTHSFHHLIVILFFFLVAHLITFFHTFLHYCIKLVKLDIYLFYLHVCFFLLVILLHLDINSWKKYISV